MAKVTITIEDDTEGDSVDIKAEFDPPLKKKRGKFPMTAAQKYALSILKDGFEAGDNRMVDGRPVPG
jgi:hypothetical protein